MLRVDTKISSSVDDIRANRAITNSIQEFQTFQENLTGIYKWAEDTNMVFNSEKFECLRFWPGKVSKPDFLYKSPDGSDIEEKLHLRDLGVELSSDLSFSSHIENSVASCNKLIGWAF